MQIYVNGHHDGMLIEAPAGLLDGDDPEAAIRREAEEETGVRVGAVQRLFEVFMSPGSVTERVAFFAAPYSPGDRVGVRGQHRLNGPWASGCSTRWTTPASQSRNDTIGKYWRPLPTRPPSPSR